MMRLELNHNNTRCVQCRSRSRWIRGRGDSRDAFLERGRDLGSFHQATTMSLDLDWSLLDEQLADGLTATFSKALDTAKRPDFLGPISVSSFDFGIDPPSCEISHIGDIWTDFLNASGDEDDDDEEGEAAFTRVRADARARGRTPGSWQRTASGANEPEGVKVPGHKDPFELERYAAQNLPFYGTHPSHLRTYRNYTPSDVQPVHAAGSSASAFGGPPESVLSPSIAPHWGRAVGVPPTPWSAGAGPWTPAQSPGYFAHWQTFPRDSDALTRAPSYLDAPPSPPHHELSADPAASASGLPTLQLHLSITWPTTTFRLTLATSLRINFPSPMFMSLPLQIGIVGFVFQGTVALALEGERKRVHISILDDPHASPAQSGPSTSASTPAGDGPTMAAHPGSVPAYRSASHTGTGPPLSAGARLLPNLAFESSVGQADKHVLKNVGKVEKFVQDVVRKAIEDEVSLSRLLRKSLGWGGIPLAAHFSSGWLRMPKA